MSFRGPILTADDAGYHETRTVWNSMADRKPAIIARCTGTADALTIVRLCRDHQLLNSVRSGGHNVAGTGVCERGMMIDTSLMKGVFVDPVARTVRAQAGCVLGDVDRETQVHGLAAVLGYVSATGIAGLTTGGGFGYLTRKYGWTCDNVVSFELVTAAGEVVRASKTEHQELFWCLRGGSGNFGIVTSIEYELYPVGPEIVGGLIAWPYDQTRDVLGFLREFIQTAPRELGIMIVARCAPPAPFIPKEMHGKPIIAVAASYSGKPDDGERVLAPLKAFGKPVADVIVRRPYVQMQSIFDGGAPKGKRNYWKSENLPDLSPGACEVMASQIATMPSPMSLMFFFPVGGALNELPADHSPAGNRDAKFVCNIASMWDRAEDDRANIAWARDTWEKLKPHTTGGVYVNFLADDDGADRVASAFGSNHERLTALKHEYDPLGLFRHCKALPTT
jgi:FAD/FMN-containing dehydrogenase